MSDLYRGELLALAATAEGDGRLDPCDGQATVSNPLCGDRVVVTLRLGDDQRIAALRHETRACVVCQASAVMLFRAARGLGYRQLLDLAEGLALYLAGGEDCPAPALPGIGLFAPARRLRSRHCCVNLPFQGALAALDDAGAAAGGGTTAVPGAEIPRGT